MSWAITVSLCSPQFVTSFGSRGEGPGQFIICPRGLIVDCNGVVYVCDEDNKRIQLF